MKILLIGSLLFSTAGFAQSLDINGYKQLLTARKATLETVKQGMTKKVITTSQVSLPEGICSYSLTSVQTVMKVESDRIIVHTADSFLPVASAACTAANYLPFQENILFYDLKPNLDAELASLDESEPTIKSIVKEKEIVTMSIDIVEEDFNEKFTVKYDLTKSGFKNLILTQGLDYKIVTEDTADADVNKIDLKNVLFCDNNDGDNTECAQGDFSDILF